MNFEREPWRPIFLREPVSQRGWNLVTRGLRVYLIRVAEDDGTLLKRCGSPTELASTLAAHDAERELVADAIERLLEDGFLRWDGVLGQPGRLRVDRLVTFPGRALEPIREDDEVDGESAEDRQRRLARNRKRRARSRTSATRRDPRRVTERDIGSVTERDQRDLPPHTPPSEIHNKYEKEGEARAHASVTERDTEGVTERDTASVTRRDALSGPPYYVPDEWAPKATHRARCAELGLDVNAIAQAFRDTEFRAPFSNWDRRFGKFIGEERAKAETANAARGNRAEDAGTRGHERVEPQSEHRRFADEHGLDLGALVAQFNADPRTRTLATVDAWRALQRLLDAAARKNGWGRYA